MRPEDILEMLRKHPFEPFRIHLSDGVAFDVRHQDMAIVQPTTSPLFSRGDQGGSVAVPGPEGPDGPAERTVHCAVTHIARAEVVNGAATRG